MLIIVPSIVGLIVVFAVKWLHDKFRALDLALTLHVNGVLLFLPPLLNRKDLEDWLVVALVSCALLLLVTGSCYSKSNKKFELGTPRLEKIALAIASCIYVFGVILNIAL